MASEVKDKWLKTGPYSILAGVNVEEASDDSTRLKDEETRLYPQRQKDFKLDERVQLLCCSFHVFVSMWVHGGRKGKNRGTRTDSYPWQQKIFWFISVSAAEREDMRRWRIISRRKEGWKRRWQVIWLGKHKADLMSICSGRQKNRFYSLFHTTFCWVQSKI